MWWKPNYIIDVALYVSTWSDILMNATKNIICTWHRDSNHGSLVDKSWLIRRKRKIETWLLCQCVVSNLYAGLSLSETKKQPWPLHFNRHIRLVGSWTRRGCKLFTRFTRYYVVTSNLISDTNQNGPTSL